MWAEAVAELDRREQATERLLPAGQEWFYLHQPLKPRMRVPRLIRCNRVQAVGILATGGQLASANEINGENYSCSCSALHEHDHVEFRIMWSETGETACSRTSAIVYST